MASLSELHFDEEEEDFSQEASGGRRGSADETFDRVVGALEEAIMDDEFRSSTEAFCRANCSVFENTDENKLEYMDLFTKYTDRVEQYLEKRIEDAFPGLTLDAVGEMMKDRADEVAGDVFDVLISLGDFDEFKSLMLSYREQVEAEAHAAAAAEAAAAGFARSAAPIAASSSSSASEPGSGSHRSSPRAGEAATASSAVEASVTQARAIDPAAEGVALGVAGLSLAGVGVALPPISPIVAPVRGGRGGPADADLGFGASGAEVAGMAGPVGLMPTVTSLGRR